MQPQLTTRQLWVMIDGPQGTEFIQGDLIDLSTIKSFDSDKLVPLPESISMYAENRFIYSLDIIKGYGIRLSMPGYLDCTPWSVYSTKNEAINALKELTEYE